MPASDMKQVDQKPLEGSDLDSCADSESVSPEVLFFEKMALLSMGPHALKNPLEWLEIYDNAFDNLLSDQNKVKIRRQILRAKKEVRQGREDEWKQSLRIIKDTYDLLWMAIMEGRMYSSSKGVRKSAETRSEKKEALTLKVKQLFGEGLRTDQVQKRLADEGISVTKRYINMLVPKSERTRK